MRSRPASEPPVGRRGLRRREPARRDDLLDRIVGYLGNHGIGELSLDALAGYLGTNTYSLTYQFGSVDELLAVAVRQAVERLVGASSSPSSTDDAQPSAVVRRLWEATTRAENGGLVRTMLEATSLAYSRSDRFRDAMTDLMSDGAEQLAAGMERAGADEATARHLAIQAFSTLIGVHVDLIASGDRDSARRAIDDLCRWVDEQA